MTLREAGVSITRSRWMGPVRRMRTSDWTLVGQDGGQSVRCGDDVLFFFSDTLLVRAGGDIAGRSPLQLFWGRLRQDRVALASLGFIVFLILLANDRELMGQWVNKRSTNGIALAIVAFIAVCGAAYGIDSFLQTVHVIG